MTAKFAHYAALSEASRQVSQQMTNLQRSFEAARSSSQSGQKKATTTQAPAKPTTKAAKSRA